MKNIEHQLSVLTIEIGYVNTPFVQLLHLLDTVTNNNAMLLLRRLLVNNIMLNGQQFKYKFSRAIAFLLLQKEKPQSQIQDVNSRNTSVVTVR